MVVKNGPTRTDSYRQKIPWWPKLRGGSVVDLSCERVSCVRSVVVALGCSVLFSRLVSFRMNSILCTPRPEYFSHLNERAHSLFGY